MEFGISFLLINKTSYAHKSHRITDCLAWEMCYFKFYNPQLDVCG